MSNELTVVELSKLAGPKTDAILAAIKQTAQRGKDAVKGKKLVEAEKGLEGLNRLKKNPAIAKVDTRGAEKAVETAKSERIAQGAKVGAGLAAAGAAGVLLTKALKRGSKGAVMSASKKEKLMKALKKHRKGIAIGGGAAVGATGLASMLKG